MELIDKINNIMIEFKEEENLLLDVELDVFATPKKAEELKNKIINEVKDDIDYLEEDNIRIVYDNKHWTSISIGAIDISIRKI